jgi:Cu/Zn superoxide dismutase
MKKYLLILLFCISCIGHKYQKAVVKLEPVQGSKISGIIYLEQKDSGVALKGELNNLNRKLHAFHIHTNGDITKADGTGTAGHYYGINYKEGKNIVGNLGNIKRQNKLTQHTDFIDGLTIDEIAGRSMVIHASIGSKKYSKFIDSGKRVATGVIGVME